MSSRRGPLYREHGEAPTEEVAVIRQYPIPSTHDERRKRMAVKRGYEDYYERADKEEGFPLATAIRWVGIIVVTIIVAYVAIRILTTVQAVFS